MLAGSVRGCEDAQVTVLDKLTYAGNRDNLPGSHVRLLFVRGDICDRDCCASCCPATTPWCTSPPSRTSTVPWKARATSSVRTSWAPRHCSTPCLDSGVERVVHVSTDEVYGSIDEGSWTEEWPLAPNSPYAASKAGSDLVARAYWRSHGLDLSITRCSNNYGPYQHPEKLIPLFVTNLLEGRRVPLYGEGANVREWLHVDDHCRGIHLVLNQGRAGEVYNIGGGNERTNLAITEQLLELTGAGAEAIQRVPDRKAHDLRYSIEETKIRDELGYAPRIGFEQGLADTVAWYRDNPDWWKAAKHGTDRAVA